jgi:hypothetical protein
MITHSDLHGAVERVAYEKVACEAPVSYRDNCMPNNESRYRKAELHHRVRTKLDKNAAEHNMCTLVT